MPTKWKQRSKNKPKDPADYKDIASRFEDVNEVEFEGKIVLYGRAGTGKTTVAATFPKPVIILDCSEKGTDSVRGYAKNEVRRIVCKSWSDVEMMYWYLKRSNKEGFETVVIDTVSNLQELAMRQWIEERGKKTNNDDEGGSVIAKWGMFTKRDWGGIAAMLKEQILNFRDLPINVVFIAHERTFNAPDEDDEGDDRIDPSVGPRVMPSVASVMNAAVNWIGNTFIREEIKEIKIGKKTKVRKRMQYWLRIGPHSYYMTKIRKPKNIIAPEAILDPTYEKIAAVARGESVDD